MILNIVYWLLLVLLTVLFGYLVTRAWRSRRAVAKWGGTILAGLLTLLLAFITITSAIGLYQLYAPRGNPVTALKVAGTAEQIARGEHLAATMCVSCHSTNNQLPLTGGRDIATDSPLPLGHLVSINLTPGGPLKNWSDGEILRAINEGVDREGHPLLVMSGNGMRYLSDDDKQAIIAYLRSQQPMTNVTADPADQPSLLMAAMLGSGLFKLTPPLTGAIKAPPRGATAEYGKYIVSYSDCTFCHGDNLTGGTSAIAPKGPNLRAVRGWTAEQFISTIRTGTDPGNHKLSDVMPWQVLSRLDDVELTAVYTYLHGLPASQ